MSPPDITHRREWGARNPRNRSRRRESVIDFAFLHHTPNHNDYAESQSDDHVRDIQNYHMDNNEWDDIGYHFLVDKYGNIYEGREVNVIGAHAGGHNTRSIGIAYLGDGDHITEEAKRGIAELYNYLEERLGKHLHRKSHRDVRSTYCPGDTADHWWKTDDPDDYSETPDTEDDEMIGPGAEEEIGRNAITWWQWQINKYLHDGDPHGGHVSGTYDQETVDAVKEVQKSFHFKQTGILDPTTRTRMLLYVID